jgi:hypothetical protein
VPLRHRQRWQSGEIVAGPGAAIILRPANEQAENHPRV